MNWTSYTFCHVGNHRTSNQDALFSNDNCGLWVVADGMGGHEAGEIASQTIVQTIANLSQSGSSNSHLQNICSMLEDVNQQLFEQNQDNERTVGSTIALLQADQEHANFIWMGDSRIYLLREHTLQQLTTDHSYVQALINQGKLTADEAEQHQRKNIITRAIGVAAECEIEIGQQTLQAGDVFLLCSDGLYNEISQQELLAILDYSEPEQAINTLAELCLSREAKDNVSFILVEIQA